MEYRRVFIETAVKFYREGGMRPLWLVWEDGRKFSIDRVKYIERAPAHAGAVLPVRYTCMIADRERNLYFEEETQRWFLEIPL